MLRPSKSRNAVLYCTAPNGQRISTLCLCDVNDIGAATVYMYIIYSTLDSRPLSICTHYLSTATKVLRIYEEAVYRLDCVE